MNIQNVGSLVCKFFSQGVGVGVRTPTVNSIQLSNALGRVSNSSATSPAANISRGTSGIGNSSEGVVRHLSGVRGGINPSDLNVPPMAQRVAMAYYNASSTSGTNLVSRDLLSRNVTLSEGMRGEDINTTQNKNECHGNLPPIAQRLMAELAKHEEKKANSSSVEQNSNLPPIAQQLMAELAKHEAGKANRDPIAPESPMGRELQQMVSNFEKLRSGTL
ncbi:TPA: hypothetical protein ACS8BP_003616 [Providencia alcalifaciens]|nr:hypothetical protein [Providencia alcalifaciens]